MGESKGRKRLAAGTVVFLALVLSGIGIYAAATFTSNPQTVEAHGQAGTISSTIAPGNVTISYIDASYGLTGYATCVAAVYGPAPTVDNVLNFTNAAPGDSCTGTFTLTDTGTLPGILNATLGASSYNVCATATSINCYDVTWHYSNATIQPHGTVTESVTIEYAPGSTVQGLRGAAIVNTVEWIGA